MTQRRIFPKTTVFHVYSRTEQGLVQYNGGQRRESLDELRAYWFASDAADDQGVSDMLGWPHTRVHWYKSGSAGASIGVAVEV